MHPKLLISREVEFSVGRACHSQVVKNPQMHQNRWLDCVMNCTIGAPVAHCSTDHSRTDQLPIWSGHH